LAPTRNMRRLTAVTFDLWDTLIQEVPGGSKQVARIRTGRIAELLESLGRPQPVPVIEAAYAETGEFLNQAWAENRDITVRDQVEFMLGRMDWRLPSKMGPEAFSAVEDVYAVGMLDHRPKLLPDAREVLDGVRETGVRMGLISNTGRTPGSVLRTIMRDHGILGQFDVTTFSDETLVRKPAPEIFNTTLESLGVQADGAIHVGDDPRADIDGAKGYGMGAIQVRSEKHDDNMRADARVDRLREVVDLVVSMAK
jgi:putative hydrolase of the HAD superfamily